MSYTPRFLQFPGYETVDIREFLKRGHVDVRLKRRDDKPFCCFRCLTPLKNRMKTYPMKIRTVPVMGYSCFLELERVCGWCEKCKKTRAEEIEFISRESPHYTKDFTWCLGRMCEFAPVSRTAEFNDVDPMTAWRVDLRRMQHMLKHYRIPPVKLISVDEVYARKKPKSATESRDNRFFTVITDLKTRRVVWVSESRTQGALEEFFQIIGEEACKDIEAVAMDQHDGYAAAVRKHCPRAKIVWDRFHLMQKLNEVINEVLTAMFERLAKDSPVKRLLQGKYKYIFLTRANRRTKEEAAHLEKVTEMNRPLLEMEVLKERFYTFFDASSRAQAEEVFEEIGDWARSVGLPGVRKWWEGLKASWGTLGNYFEYRVTTSLSEGINNVIKALKRSAFGYRNMTYFRLKIMQRCGYLNSRFVSDPNMLTAGMDNC